MKSKPNASRRIVNAVHSPSAVHIVRRIDDNFYTAIKSHGLYQRYSYPETNSPFQGQKDLSIPGHRTSSSNRPSRLPYTDQKKKKPLKTRTVAAEIRKNIFTYSSSSSSSRAHMTTFRTIDVTIRATAPRYAIFRDLRASHVYFSNCIKKQRLRQLWRIKVNNRARCIARTHVVYMEIHCSIFSIIRPRHTQTKIAADTLIPWRFFSSTSIISCGEREKKLPPLIPILIIYKNSILQLTQHNWTLVLKWITREDII